MGLFELTNPPRVSLALPVYNGEKFVAEAIRSILDQDYENFELIITDNASTDGTERICRDFAASDGRIRYVRNEYNLGAGPNHNLGFELSVGEYFKWCAADDCISRKYICTCVSILDSNPDVVLVYGATQSIDEDGRLIPLVGDMMCPLPEGDGPARRFRRHLTDKGTNFETFGVFRSDVLRKTKLHRSYYSSDRALISEMALLGRFVYVPGIVFYSREHPDRSMNIRDRRARVTWQDTGVKSKYDLAHCKRLAHLIEIAIRHRGLAPLGETLPFLIGWALSPPQLARYAANLIGVVSPSAQHWLFSTGRWLTQKSPPKSATLDQL
jgi:glycosyltransferase involved in cell wall biosynthesis